MAQYRKIDNIPFVINEDTKRYTQPEQILTRLKPHQLAVLNQAINMENEKMYINYKDTNYSIKTTKGIIGDHVGSGKTLSVLSIIATHNNIPVDNSIINTVNNSIKIYCENELPKFININIIVVPHTIIKQWVETIEKQTKLSYVLVNTSKTLSSMNTELEKQVVNTGLELSEYDQKFTKAKKYFETKDIILVSSTFYNNFYSTLSIYIDTDKVNISRIIFDEAYTIKIPSCDTINSNFTWFVTSTYNNLLHPKGVHKVQHIPTGQIYSSMHYAMNYHNLAYDDLKHYRIDGVNHNGFIKRTLYSIHESINFSACLVLRSDVNFIRESFKLESPIDNYLVCEYPTELNIVKDVVSGEVLSMLNAGNIKGAIEHLNCTKVNDEKMLIKAVTKDLENELHNVKLEYGMKSQMHYSSANAKKEALEKLEDKMSIIDNKIRHIKEKVEENSNCPICYGDVENKTLVKCCKTAYCLECISMWLNSQTHNNQKCPFCRAQITLNDTIVLNSEAELCNKEKEVLKNKIFYLKLFLEKRTSLESPMKLLIFSDYMESFGNITTILDKFSLKYSKIKGSGISIANTIERYKKTTGPDKIDVLMLNTQDCGSGINLENTTDMIVYHQMSKEKDEQIVGRAQRPGRTGKLNILRLCFENEIQNITHSNKISTIV